MTYFTHTLKGCGTVALALVLSACGEKATVASAQASNQGLEGSTDVTVSTNNPDLNQGQTPTSEVSSVGAPSSDVVDSDANSNLPATPNQPNDPVDVAPVSGGDPLITLIATTDSDLNSSGTRLVWSGENVDSCTASGAWEGAIEPNGALDLEHTEAGDLTYLISCSGASGTAMAMVTVTVESTALAWQAPVKNTNGTALTDLAGYNLYYGTESGRYTQVKPVRNPGQTNLELPVEAGTYYLAMTAYDESGNESELSNEIVRHVF